MVLKKKLHIEINGLIIGCIHKLSHRHDNRRDTGMTKNEDRIQSIAKQARELFDSKQHNCAESVFMALNEAFDGGLSPETAKRIATASEADWEQQVERAGP